MIALGILLIIGLLYLGFEVLGIMRDSQGDNLYPKEDGW